MAAGAQPIPAGPIGQSLGTTGVGLLSGAGAVAGAIPTPSSSSGTYGSNVNTSGTSLTQQQIQQLINQLIQSSQATQQTSTTTPVLSPQTQAYLNQLITNFGAVQTPSIGGYVAQGTQAANANAATQEQAVNAILAARGLSTSPVAATTNANIEQNRLNNITQLQEQAPLQLNALQLQNLLAQAQLLGAIPRGQITTGTGLSTGSQQTMGLNQTGETTSGVTSGTQSTSGYNNTQQQQGGGVGGGLAGGIATFLKLLGLGI